jgi:Peptidase M15
MGEFMKTLSENFTEAELDVEDAEERIIRNAAFLCIAILEPLRAEVGPLIVHCGYRPPEHNAEVGGVPTSYHLFIGDECAADVVPTSYKMQEAFDWLRLKSSLPFSKVILEHDKAGEPRCIHIQAHATPAMQSATREAFTGLIAGESKEYTPCECAPC